MMMFKQTNLGPMETKPIKHLNFSLFCIQVIFLPILDHIINCDICVFWQRNSCLVHILSSLYHMPYICQKSNHEPLVLHSPSDINENKAKIYESPVFILLSTRNQPGHIRLRKISIICFSLYKYIYLWISKLCIYWLNDCPKYCITFYALSLSTDKMNRYWCDIATIGVMGISDPYYVI